MTYLGIKCTESRAYIFWNMGTCRGCQDEATLAGVSIHRARYCVAIRRRSESRAPTPAPVHLLPRAGEGARQPAG